MSCKSLLNKDSDNDANDDDDEVADENEFTNQLDEPRSISLGLLQFETTRKILFANSQMSNNSNNQNSSSVASSHRFLPLHDNSISHQSYFSSRQLINSNPV